MQAQPSLDIDRLDSATFEQSPVYRHDDTSGSIWDFDVFEDDIGLGDTACIEG
jgi:hypothetical protein